MRYLTLGEVLDLHRRVIEQSAARTESVIWAALPLPSRSRRSASAVASCTQRSKKRGRHSASHWS